MQEQFPGYQPGTYVIDETHSSVSFTIRHMMVAKVRGAFTNIAGTIELPEDPAQASITASVDPSTIDTRNTDRDAHLRSGDFFATDEHPAWTFTSTGARATGEGVIVDGQLQIKGVERPLSIEIEYGGIGQDAYGATRAGASATFRIKRSEFDITFNQTLETGGVMLGEDVNVELEISAVKQ